MGCPPLPSAIHESPHKYIPLGQYSSQTMLPTTATVRLHGGTVEPDFFLMSSPTEISRLLPQIFMHKVCLFSQSHTKVQTICFLQRKKCMGRPRPAFFQASWSQEEPLGSLFCLSSYNSLVLTKDFYTH